MVSRSRDYTSAKNLSRTLFHPVVPMLHYSYHKSPLQAPACNSEASVSVAARFSAVSKRLVPSLFVPLTLCLSVFISTGAVMAAPATSAPYGWAFNSYGQVGNGTQAFIQTPAAVTTTGVLAGKTITQLATGFYHSVALDSDGKVYSWGDNSISQLGDGSNNNSTVPVAVGGALSGKTITQIVAGAYHTLALDSDGKVYSWGYNYDGELGNGTRSNTSNVPVLVGGALSGRTITQLSAGWYHSMALDSNGNVFSWGYNDYGTIGTGTSDTYVVLPAALNKGLDFDGKVFTQIAAGGAHSLALTSDGLLLSWGANPSGELGNGNNINSNRPKAVNQSGVLNGKTISSISAGGAYSLVLCADGTLASWGYNGYGQLGNGNNSNSAVPVLVDRSGVLSGKTISQLATGSEHSLALCADGTLIGWGRNTEDELGNGNGTYSSSPVVAGNSGVMANKRVTGLAKGSTAYHALVLANAANVAPVVNSVSIAPNSPTTNSLLTATPAASDVDSDSLTFTYQWNKNGSAIGGATGSTLDLSVIGNGDKGNTITVTVVANDGKDDSAPFTSAPLTVGNTAPTMTTVSISPTDPKTDTILTATPAGGDVDSDTLTFTYQWKKGGVDIVGATGNTLNLATAGNGSKGDLITVEVKAYDGSAYSTALTSSSVTVADTAPVVALVTLTPTNPNTSTLLTATPTGEDLDGDPLTYSYVWTKNNNVIAGQTGATLDLSVAGNGDNGDVIAVTVTANDGSLSSAPFTSAPVTVVDPVVTPTLQVTSVTVNPGKPQTNSDVAAVVVATGPAGAKISYSYQWKKNGTNLPGETGRTMDLAKTGNGDRGDLISVEVRATTGALTSTPVTSPAVAVVNAGPVVNSLSLTPSAPKTNTILRAIASATDPDGDAIVYMYVWMKNGVKIQGEDGSTLDLGKPGNGDTGDKISVLIKARDYSAASAPVTSAEVTILNSGPVMTSLSISPTNPGTSDLLTAHAAGYDPDGDTTRFQYEWYKNGIKIAGEDKATLDLSKPNNGDVGDVITVLAKIREASLASAPMTSAPVTIVAAPTPPAVSALRSSSSAPSGASS
ncbi:hypothetical protein EON83_27305 [bacterium]|nr:MAG: hypothetical protein EON83_27305 [bacterium]